jgi:protein subunit release factor A
MLKTMIDIKDEDIEITHIKGGGPGGQNRNKRMSGIRIKHLPTGIVAVATERRSQEQNRTAAMERLANKLEELFHKPKARVKTKVTRTAKRERLTSKKITSKKKESRRVGRGDFES